MLLSRRKIRPLLRQDTLNSRYDVIIVGGGAHGLATAYYLAARHGITDVAVVERAYIGAGGSGRNTTIIRSNYGTPDAIRFFKASADLYEGLSAELDFNVLLSPRGLLLLAHSEDALQDCRARAQLNAALGVETQLLTRDEVGERCPVLDLDCDGAPILGGALHGKGAIIRHDAVVWGYAAAAQRLGVHVVQGVNVERIHVDGDRATGIVTDRGMVTAGAVVCAVGGFVSALTAPLGLKLPLESHPLEAFVTEPIRPVLDPIVASTDLLVYLSQSARGELVVGGELAGYRGYSTRSTFEAPGQAITGALRLFPWLARLRMLRQWAGVCELTPDYSPLLGPTAIDSFYLSSGWGTWGFKAVPVSGTSMAELVSTGRTPPLIEPFRLSRFRDDQVVSERASSGTQ